MTIPVIVCGISGRISCMIASAVESDAEFQLYSRWASKVASWPTARYAESPIEDNPRPVIVDFTNIANTRKVLEYIEQYPTPLVVGTSSIGPTEDKLLELASKRCAIVRDVNFSSVYASFEYLIRQLSNRLSVGWDAGVLDIHFRAKRDAPSATGSRLVQAWNHGRPSSQPPAEVTSMRFGNGVSEHRFLCVSPSESIEVIHRVSDRSAFLPNILAGIRHAYTAAPGLYDLAAIFSSNSNIR